MTTEDRFQGQGKDYHLHHEIFPHKEELTRRLAEEVAANCQDSWPFLLDVGIGTGNTTRAVLDKKPDCHIIGVDSSKDMMEQIKKNKTLSMVSLAHEDILTYLRVAFPNHDQLAGAFSAYTIHNFERGYRKEFFNEIYRVLMPGAAFVNLDIMYPDDEKAMHKLFRWQVQKMATYAEHGRLDLSKFWLNHVCEDFDPSRRLTEGQYKLSLKEAGFKDVRKILRHEEDVLYVAKK